MFFVEFNLDDAIAVAKEEGYTMAMNDWLEGVAKKLLIRNMSVADIADITELSEEKIIELQKSIVLNYAQN